MESSKTRSTMSLICGLGGTLVAVTSGASLSRLQARHWALVAAATLGAAIYRNRVEEELREDVRQRQRVEAELRSREAQLAEAQSIAHVGSFVWNIATNELRGSDELYRIYGFEPTSSLPPGRILERVHPDDFDLVRQTIDAAVTQGTARTMSSASPASWPAGGPSRALVRVRQQRGCQAHQGPHRRRVRVEVEDLPDAIAEALSASVHRVTGLRVEVKVEPPGVPPPLTTYIATPCAGTEALIVPLTSALNFMPTSTAVLSLPLISFTP